MISLLASCSGMNDNIREYLERGEIEYIGKADSVKAIGGKERIRISWQVSKDPRIESCIIYWNNKTDSAVFPVNESQIIGDSMSVYINIPEGTYLFTLYQRGNGGERSIASEVSGIVYGNSYQENIRPRKIVNITYYTDSCEIIWIPAAEDMVKTVFTYEQRSGDVADITIPPENTETVIPNYKPGGIYFVTTFHIPEPEALDTFKVVSPEERFSTYYQQDF
jgi:hypothetical protein